MQLQWSAHYFDGQNARREEVRVLLEPAALMLQFSDGRTMSWAYDEIRQSQGSYAGEPVRLERGAEFPEILVVRDGDFLAALHRMLAGRVGHLHNPAGRGRRLLLTIAAGALSTAILAVVYLWGIPGVAALAAPFVPVRWEEQFGDAVMAHLAPMEQRCADPVRLAKLEEIAARLMATEPAAPYRVQIVVVNDPTVNALAAPGGRILIYRGMLDATESAEQMAGVVAHELQHVLRRHVTRALLEHASSGVLIAAVTGDGSAVAGIGLESARLLAQLRFSRVHEMEADREGMNMLLRAGIDPAGMLAIFEYLSVEERRGRSLPVYLSTHPASADRVQSLAALARGARPSAKPLLGDDRWKEVQRLCPALPSGEKPKHFQ